MILHILENSPIAYYVNQNNSAQWVLFLHAAYVNHSMFRSQIAYFKDEYNLLCVDIIGHGKSVNTKKGETVSQMSTWLHQIMEREKIDKLHVLGVSLGAVLAQDFANQYPDRVASLACFGGYDINNFDPGLQKNNGFAQMRMMFKALVSVKWFAAANRKISAYTEQAQNAFYEMNLQFSKKSFMYLATLHSMVNAHPPQKRAYPLLIGCGEHDIPMELDAIRRWEKTEPGCLVHIFKNAGHCVNMDAPQDFNTVLEKFWHGEAI